MKPFKLALVILALQTVVMAQAPGEHWVGTWATAEVGRPQTPPPPQQGGPPPFMPNQCPANPAPAGGGGRAGFVQFTNQTLRQIVHTSVGGSRLRIVLSNKYGTAP